MNDILEGMKWRAAINKFDTAKKLTDDQIKKLMETVFLTPSSFGLQPWRFLVVTNPEIRAQLQVAGYNQPKIAEASHLVVFAVEKIVDDKLVDKYMASVGKIRGMAPEALKGYADMIKGSIAGRTPEQNVEWATRQVYIALGTLVAAGAVEGIDVAPMEGFDPKKFDEILGLDKLGLSAVVIAAVGFRSADDPVSKMPKVRYSKDELMIEVK